MVEWSKRQYVRYENRIRMNETCCLHEISMISVTKSQYRGGMRIKWHKAWWPNDNCDAWSSNWIGPRNENENNMCAGMRSTVDVCWAEKAVRRRCQRWCLTICMLARNPYKRCARHKDEVTSVYCNTGETWGRARRDCIGLMQGDQFSMQSRMSACREALMRSLAIIIIKTAKQKDIWLSQVEWKMTEAKGSNDRCS
jgi:hypothetical protein